MKKHYQASLITYGATSGFIITVAVLLFLIPRVENFSSLSSHEIDDALYERLDWYEQVFKEEPDLAVLLQQALTEPEKLTVQQRHEYLSYERRFFGGWEAAYEHTMSGYLDAERFEVWDKWYVNELRRRPEFVWQENRGYFSPAFAEHVDRALQSP